MPHGPKFGRTGPSGFIPHVMTCVANLIRLHSFSSMFSTCERFCCVRERVTCVLEVGGSSVVGVSKTKTRAGTLLC